VFISYAREDKEIAEKIYDYLKGQNIIPWIDSTDILPSIGFIAFENRRYLFLFRFHSFSLSFFGEKVLPCFRLIYTISCTVSETF